VYAVVLCVDGLPVRVYCLDPASAVVGVWRAVRARRYGPQEQAVGENGFPWHVVPPRRVQLSHGINGLSHFHFFFFFLLISFLTPKPKRLAKFLIGTFP
jgi:hypothetical protein